VDVHGPQLVADDLGVLTSLAVDADGVYWASLDAAASAAATGNIRSWSKSGAHETKVLAAAQAAPVALTASAGALYWVNSKEGSGAVMSAPTRGGATVTLTAADGATALAVDGDVVYFLEEHGGGSILAVPKTGGARAFVATVGPATELAYDGRDLFYLSGQVMSIPAGGGFPARVSETCFYPVSLAVDETQAFYGCQDGTLRAAPKSGGPTRTLFRRDVGGGSISGIALDATSVYFTSTSDGTVNRVSKQGGAVTVLASGEDGAGPIAVDATDVYYATRGSDGAKNSVKRVAK
jgi:hypothetical protein